MSDKQEISYKRDTGARSEPAKPRSLERPGSGLDVADCCVTLEEARDVIRRKEAYVDSLLSIIEAAGLATMQECTCGGNPYEDPECCPACKIYHRIKAASCPNT